MPRISRPWFLVLAFWFSAQAFLEARPVRVATYNIQNGPEAVGSADYEATKAVLARIDADVVGFQEVLWHQEAVWRQLAQELGYAHVVFGAERTDFTGDIRLGYFSRFPIAEVSVVRSPAGANEISRLPLRVVIEVPGAARPLVLWNMHHKADDPNPGTTPGNQFRRAVEAYRIVQDMNTYRAANPGHDEFIMLGDLNDNIFQPQNQAVEFAAVPSTVPGGYRLGSDIPLPIAYRAFPDDRYAAAGGGLHRLDVRQQDGFSRATRPVSGRTLDYLLLSTALRDSPLGAPRGEVYHSQWDDLYPGLPKAGAPLNPNTSLTASDHLALFADVEMADAVPPGFTVDPEGMQEFSGPVGGPFDPEGHSYAVVNTGAAPVEWEVSADVPWLRVSPAAGVVLPAESQVVTVAVDENATFASPGVYAGRVRFTDRQTGAGITRLVQVTVTSSGEYFTQQFTTSAPFNLANRSVTFVPDPGGFYRATIRAVSAFPTDPAGGAVLSLTDDGFVAVSAPPGRSFPFFGVPHPQVYIGSNGYLTFGSGDWEYRVSLASHFDRPRLSALYVDLNPAARGTISWRQLPDRLVVTYDNVRQWGTDDSNTFQVEVFFDGRIRLTWLRVDAAAVLVGLSPGGGVPAGFANSTFVSFPPGARFADWAPGEELTRALLRHYALGGADSPPAAGELPRAVFTGDRLSLSAVVRDNDPGLRVAGESVDEISGLWSTQGVTVRGRRQGVSQAEVGPGFERREYAVPVAGTDRRFLRLRVELEE